MENEQSDLKEVSGAQNANPTKNQEIEVLEGKGSRQEIKAKARATEPKRNNLPGVNLQ